MATPLQAKATPLPVTQIAILMAVRLAEPIQYTGTYLLPFAKSIDPLARMRPASHLSLHQ